MILYGLPTCSDCTKARKAFAAAGQDVAFRDVRAEPLDAEERAALLAEFGDNIIDKSTQTYRNLNAWMRESEAEDQLVDTPALMARPIITDGARWSMGWTTQVRESWGV